MLKYFDMVKFLLVWGQH